MIDGTRSLGELVNERPARARVLERLGFDYCCTGPRSLADACASAGLGLAEVAPLLDVDDTTEDWAQLGPAALVDHLERVHHAFLWDELPRLAGLADKVLDEHGARHPELTTVRRLLHELKRDLEPHMLKEERVLFPMIRELATADSPAKFHCGSLRNPISVMLIEHERAGELLRMLRGAADGYVVPADGCTSYAMLYDGLTQLEADTHLHIHKENNLLFPTVIQLEEGR
jgi:regulator of cell morphogenesis and NO signaling